MKKILLAILVLSGMLTSCSKFEDFNTDQKKPAEVPGGYVFANAQKALGDIDATPNVNLNIFNLISQYWTETTYQDEANYDIVNRTIADNQYVWYYRNILADFKNAYQVIYEETAISEEELVVQQNRLYIIDILEVFCYSHLVDLFGDVPYTEALDINNFSPAYDDAATIYQSLISKLNTAIDGLDNTYGSFGSDDLYFEGDVAMWIKFANSLKLRIGITLADYDADLAKTLVESSYEGAFGPGEKAQLVYLGGTNANPIYQNLVQSGRHDFVPANTIVDLMNNLEDPRRALYFTLIDTNTVDPQEPPIYLGGEYGYPNNFSICSHISDPVQEATYPNTFMDYVEVLFLKAEAAARGFNVGGTAEGFYQEGITASILDWGGSQEDVDTYLARPDVAWATAAGDWKQKIGTQCWIAYYVRGFTGFNSWRRLDYPTLNLPPVPETDDGQVPKRFTYPINEQTLNAESYAAAADAIGGDLMSTKVFWDIY